VHSEKELVFSIFGIFKIDKNIIVIIKYSFPVIKIINEFRYNLFGNLNIIVLYMVTLTLISK